MTALPRFRALPVIVALVALSVVVSVAMARAVPLPDGATASGGVAPQSTNCSAGREEDEGCIPRGPGSPTRPGGPVQPPVTPPITPPVAPPITPPVGPLTLPPGILPKGWSKVIFGRADAKLIIHDENQDVTYASNIVDLLFFPYQTRGQAEVPGRTQYFVGGSGSEKVPTVIWTVRGSRGGCTVEGEARVTLPIWDPTRDPTHLAFGYMVVVEPGSGDFHSVLVKAFDADAYYTQTCPGNPPVITKVPFEAGYLLHIPWQKNDRVGDRVIYKGHKSYDQSDTLDFLNLLPPGTTLPQIALDALSQMSGSGTSRRYHWNWELHPVRVGD